MSSGVDARVEEKPFGEGLSQKPKGIEASRGQAEARCCGAQAQGGSQ